MAQQLAIARETTRARHRGTSFIVERKGRRWRREWRGEREERERGKLK
jgi:hypothetical protein